MEVLNLFGCRLHASQNGSWHVLHAHAMQRASITTFTRQAATPCPKRRSESRLSGPGHVKDTWAKPCSFPLSSRRLRASLQRWYVRLLRIAKSSIGESSQEARFQERGEYSTRALDTEIELKEHLQVWYPWSYSFLDGLTFDGEIFIRAAISQLASSKPGLGTSGTVSGCHSHSLS